MRGTSLVFTHSAQEEVRSSILRDFNETRDFYQDHSLSLYRKKKEEKRRRRKEGGREERREGREKKRGLSP